MVLSCEQMFVGIASRKVVVAYNEDSENIANEFKLDAKAYAQKFAALRDIENNDNPFTILNIDKLYEKVLEWQKRLPQIKPYYAVKCNNDPVILKTLASIGIGFDCASRGEIDMVVGTGLATGDNVIYANPCKTRSYIEHAAKCGIRKMTFDSLEELSKIKQFHDSAELILRIDVADDSAQCPLAAKFGCDPFREAPRLMVKAKEQEQNVIGISFHVGSGCNDPTAYTRAIFASRKLFDFGKKLGHDMRILDIGGGFPGHDTEKISFCHVAKIIQQALDTYFPNSSDFEQNEDNFKDLEIVAEPGRFFAFSSVTLCANIIAKSQVPLSRITKVLDDEGDGFMYYINDGVYGSFNCILFDHFQPSGEPLFEKQGAGKFATTIWGPTCDSLDRVEANIKMQEMNTGDWMCYANMGAYTAVAASNFNGFQPPQRYYIISERVLEGIFDERAAVDKIIENKTQL